MNTLKFAIKMELDGEKYYMEQAKLNENNSLYTVCFMLAEDERNHALILSNKLKGLDYVLKDSSLLSKTKNIFTDIGNIEIKEKKRLSQLDFYRIALEKEKQSIDLYRDFLSNAKDEREKELFEYLVKQEEQHFAFFEELVFLLKNAEQWVESAEFGLRGRY
jgi:rubrerythrin